MSLAREESPPELPVAIMVLTPRFQISQTDSLVVIRIHVPHIRVSAAEVISEGRDFSFYCKPYLLKLTLPGELQEGEDAHRAQYDPADENGTLVVEMKKKTPGEHFIDLDLVTKLLTSRRVTDMTPDFHEIEVLHNENFVEGEEEDSESIEKPVGGSLPKLFTKRTYGYGFNDQYTNVFTRLRDIMGDTLQIQEPEKVHPKLRVKQRIAQEFQDFDAERYLGDALDGDHDPIYDQMMYCTPFWITQWDKQEAEEKAAKARAKAGGESVEDVTKSGDQADVFDETERDVLQNKLKNKEYLIPANSSQERALLVNMLDLLFATCYDIRMTDGEPNGESAHNITRLSRQLSWMDSFLPTDTDGSLTGESILTVVKSNMRRLVIYPYLRHWKVGRKVLADVAKLLFLGKRWILKLLLRLYQVLERTDTHYLLNTVYVGDYCVWLQTVDDAVIKTLAKDFNKAKNTFEKYPNTGKDTMGLHLMQLEVFAADVESKQAEQAEQAEAAEQRGSEEEEGGAVGDDFPVIPAEFLDYASTLTSEDPTLQYLRIDVGPDQEESIVSGLGDLKDVATTAVDDTVQRMSSLLLSPQQTSKAPSTLMKSSSTLEEQILAEMAKQAHDNGVEGFGGDVHTSGITKKVLIEEISSTTFNDDETNDDNSTTQK